MLVVLLFYGRLIVALGRITRLTCPSVRPLVCLPVRHVRASKTKKRGKTKIGVNVSQAGVTSVTICLP